MAGTRVLLLGGHGKVALLMTPHLLKRSWHVTSVIRNPDHKDDILKLDQDKTDQLDVLVESLEDVKSPEQAASVLEKVEPNYVIWSAGVGTSTFPRTPRQTFHSLMKPYRRERWLRSNVCN